MSQPATTTTPLLTTALLLLAVVSAVSGFSVQWRHLGPSQERHLYHQRVVASSSQQGLATAGDNLNSKVDNLRSMTEARRLLDKLHKLDPSFDKYINLVLHRPQTTTSLKPRQYDLHQNRLRQARLQNQSQLDKSQNYSHDNLPQEVHQDLREDLLEAALQQSSTAVKRQSSSGAQICIWKVCPPSPWRRNGRPQLG